MRVVYAALVWTVLWGIFGAAVSLIALAIDPAVIDPGETPIEFARVAGGDGLLTGLAFGLLLLVAERRRRVAEIPVLRAALWGVVAAAAFRVLAITDVHLSNSAPIGAASAMACIALARATLREA